MTTELILMKKKNPSDMTRHLTAPKMLLRLLTHRPRPLCRRICYAEKFRWHAAEHEELGYRWRMVLMGGMPEQR